MRFLLGLLNGVTNGVTKISKNDTFKQDLKTNYIPK